MMVHHSDDTLCCAASSAVWRREARMAMASSFHVQAVQERSAVVQRMRKYDVPVMRTRGVMHRRAGWVGYLWYKVKEHLLYLIRA